MKNKTIIIFGAAAITLLMISSATAVPQIQNRPFLNSLKNSKRNDIIENKLDEIINSEDFSEIQGFIKKLSNEKVIGDRLKSKQSLLLSLYEEDKENQLQSNSPTTSEKLRSINIRMGLILTLLMTIASEYSIYIKAYSESHDLNLRTIFKLLIIAIIINTITNPATNIIYILLPIDIDTLEQMVYIIETYMIFLLFNIFLLNTSLEEADEISLRANMYSYNFCKSINEFLNSILGMIFGNDSTSAK